MSDGDAAARRFRLWLWLAIVVALGIFAFGLWIWVFQGAAVRKELARIRAAGEPVTGEELNALYEKPPAGKDATQVWLAAFGAIERLDYETLQSLPIIGRGPEIPPAGEDWAEQAEVEKYLEQQSEALRLLHEAAERGGAARYPIDLTQGMRMVLPHVQQTREAARLLALEAEVAAHRGDVDGAVRAVRSIFAVARSVENEPVLVSQLVRAAVDGIAIGAVERQLGVLEFTDAQLEQLQSDLRRGGYRRGMYRGMLAERVAGLMVREDPASAGITGGQRVALRLWGSADSAIYLELMGRMVDASKKPWPEALRAAEEAEAAATKAGSDPRYVLTAMLLPAVSRVYQAGARLSALNRASDAAIGVERYRRRHGELPERLEQLVPEFLPEVPADPFDGKALRYVVADDHYLIYSVGVDGRDDGGQGDMSGRPDVVFRVRVAGSDARGAPGGDAP